MRPTTDVLPDSVAAALGLDNALGSAAEATGGTEAPAESEAAVPTKDARPRAWESRVVRQKTLGGEIFVRKWVSDHKPAFAASCASSGDSQPQVRSPPMQLSLRAMPRALYLESCGLCLEPRALSLHTSLTDLSSRSSPLSRASSVLSSRRLWQGFC